VQPDNVRGYTAVEILRLGTFAKIRVTILLLALIGFSLVAAHQTVYTRNWNQTLEVTVFPINADGHLVTNEYIKSLSDDTFHIINQWGVREAERHDLTLSTPFNFRLGDQIHKRPPPFPHDKTPLDVVWWGLKFRWWAFRNTPEDDGNLTRVRLFVMYHEGTEGQTLAHSLGMQKGLMGLVHAFADHEYTQPNNVVIAHEVLHTVGASDKYGSGGNPQYPVGFADPNRNPLYPQRSAEVMAGRIPTSQFGSYMAESLRSVTVNKYTAYEINWLNDETESEQYAEN